MWRPNTLTLQSPNVQWYKWKKRNTSWEFENSRQWLDYHTKVVRLPYYLQKHFYNWNILNHCLNCKINNQYQGLLFLEMPWQYQMPILRPVHYFAHFEKLWMIQKATYLQCQWSCPSKFWSIFLVVKLVSSIWQPVTSRL